MLTARSKEELCRATNKPFPPSFCFLLLPSVHFYLPHLWRTASALHITPFHSTTLSKVYLAMHGPHSFAACCVSIALKCVVLAGCVEGLRYAVPYVESGNLSGTPAGWRARYDLHGSGELVGVLDTGLDYFHAAFHDDSPLYHNTRLLQNQAYPGHRKVASLRNHYHARYVNDTRNNGHGTAMCGAIAAAYLDQVDAPNPVPTFPPLEGYRYRGIAPKAKVALHSIAHTYDGPLDLPMDIQSALEALYADGARVFVMAFCGGGPRYTLALNKWAYLRQDALLVGAAGNSAVTKCGVNGRGCAGNTVCHPHLGANVLTIGAHRALPSAKSDAGYPDTVFELSCGGNNVVTVFATRAQFAPPPTNTTLTYVIANHADYGTFCSNDTKKIAPIAPHSNVAFFALRGICPYSEKAKNVEAACKKINANHCVLLVVDIEVVVDGPMQVAEEDRYQYIESYMFGKQDFLRSVGSNGVCTTARGPIPAGPQHFVYPGFHASHEDLLVMSGRGAYATNRKPDLVAPGEAVLLPRANTTRGFIAHTGSSVATALVGGAAALVRELLARSFTSSETPLNVHFASGEDDTIKDVNLFSSGHIPAALVKALLVHSAERLKGFADLTGAGDYIALRDLEVVTENTPFRVEGGSLLRDPHQGYGRPNLANIFNEPNAKGPQLLIVEAVVVKGGATVRIGFSVEVGIVGVTFAYTSPVAKGVKPGVVVQIPGEESVALGVGGVVKWSGPAVPGYWVVEVALPSGGKGSADLPALPVYLVLSLPPGAVVHNGSFSCAALLPIPNCASSLCNATRGAQRAAATVLPDPVQQTQWAGWVSAVVLPVCCLVWRMGRRERVKEL